MDYKSYLNLFDEILSSATSEAPYDDPRYLKYAKLNQSRMRRWNKTLKLNNGLTQAIKKITRGQNWIIIAEHWCGDAAPILPFLVRLAGQNPLIRCDIQLRDKEPHLIDSYLTNGKKGIPKLIVRDESGNDLFTWGPRPALAQQRIDELKASGIDSETIKTEIQNWYNNDNGSELQRELLTLFNKYLPQA